MTFLYDQLKEQIKNRDPTETPDARPKEVETSPAETPVPRETPAAAPAMEADVLPATGRCGVNNCQTVYSDPAMMAKHRERQHGIGLKVLNQPKARSPFPIGRESREFQGIEDHNLAAPEDWGRRWG
ncbi:MAG: hypothetical protein JW793_08945 [Acidobacteria bacterium]|nr:hypothetical protein [Acidobacteriota bacterium]